MDVQKGFDDPLWGKRDNPDAEENTAKLIAAWRKSHRPIFHVRHMSNVPRSPLRPGQPDNEFKERVAPENGEPVVTKDVNSAFIGTDLEERLRSLGIGTLVLVGLTTDHCVSTTARMAANLGFDCYLVDDATTTFERTGHNGKRYSADEIQSTTFASLNKEFAEIVRTETLLDRL